MLRTVQMPLVSTSVILPAILHAMKTFKSTTISVIISAQCGHRLRHMERAQSAQFYAPTKASINEFRLCHVFIIRLVVLSKGVGHY